MASLEGWNFTIKLCPRVVRSELRKRSQVNGDLWLVNSQNDCRMLRHPLRLRSGQGQVAAYYYFSNAAATRVALWPPKPKELFRATRTFFSRAMFAV